MIGLVIAGEHLDQRRLSRAVLAYQGMDLARGDVHRDVVEGLRAGERLGHVLDAEHARARRVRPGLPHIGGLLIDRSEQGGLVRHGPSPLVERRVPASQAKSHIIICMISTTSRFNVGPRPRVLSVEMNDAARAG